METGRLIGTLFQSRDIMHLEHLNTTSYATHKALQNYYDGILDLIDKFTEVSFGRNGRVPITIPEAKIQPAKEHLKRMQDLIEIERRNQSTELQNIMDEMLSLINNTLYLLTLV